MWDDVKPASRMRTEGVRAGLAECHGHSRSSASSANGCEPVACQTRTETRPDTDADMVSGTRADSTSWSGNRSHNEASVPNTLFNYGWSGSWRVRDASNVENGWPASCDFVVLWSRIVDFGAVEGL